MDDIDRILMTSLAHDGRASGNQLARLLPINGVSVRLRLRRLLQSEVHVKALANPAKLGLPVQSFLGIKVKPGYEASVSQQLAAYPCTTFVSRVVGEFDVIARVCARSLDDLQRFVQEEVGHLTGVQEIDSSVYLKMHAEFWNLSAKLITDVAVPTPENDALDLKLISCLNDDGRLTTRKLAHLLSVSELTVHRRLRRLVEDRIITIRGTVKAEDLGFPVSAEVLLRFDSGKLEEAVRTLKSHKQLLVVGTPTGRFNLTVVGMFRSNHDVDQVLSDFVYRIEGIEDARVVVRLTRHTDTWVVPRE